MKLKKKVTKLLRLALAIILIFQLSITQVLASDINTLNNGLQSNGVLDSELSSSKEVDTHSNLANTPIITPSVEQISLYKNAAVKKIDGSVVMWGYNDWNQCDVPSDIGPVSYVTVGKINSGAIKSDGTVAIWGGSKEYDFTPPSGLNNVKQLVLKDSYALALKNDGSVVAWGSSYYVKHINEFIDKYNIHDVKAIANSDGYLDLYLLNDGTLVYYDVGVAEIKYINNVKSLSGCGDNFIILKEDGTVEAYGKNCQKLQVPEGLIGVKYISCGYNHFLALKEDGTVRAWGENASGQCNIAEGLGDVKLIAAGYCCSMVMKADGTILFWGDGSDGRSNIPDDFKPKGPQPLSSNWNKGIDYNGNRTFYTTVGVDGKVYALGGENSDGISSDVDMYDPVKNTWTKKAAMPFGKSRFSAAVINNEIYVLGSIKPQFSLSSATQANTASVTEAAVDLNADLNTTQTTQNENIVYNGGIYKYTPSIDKWSLVYDLGKDWHNGALAAVNDKLYIIGDSLKFDDPNVYGDISEFNPLTKEVVKKAPMSDPKIWENIAVVNNKVYVSAMNGKIGNIFREYDPLTDKWRDLSSTSTQIESFKLAGIGNKLCLIGGDTYAIDPDRGGYHLSSNLAEEYNFDDNKWEEWSGGAIPEDAAYIQTAYTDNNLYLVGGVHETQDDYKNLKSVWQLPMKQSFQISGGVEHTIMVMKDGSVKAEGKNSYEQVNVPSKASNITSICTGPYFNLALRLDGTVVAWGDNRSGQCNVPQGLTNVKAVAASETGAAALKNDGTVVSWGNVPQKPDTLTNVVELKAGSNHFLALKADGTVVAWGDDMYKQCEIPAFSGKVMHIWAGYFHSAALLDNGQLVIWGMDANNESTVPADVTGKVLSVVMGQEHVAVLKTDGTVDAWGDNSYGQTTIPNELTGVAAIGAREYETVVAKEDGSIAVFTKQTPETKPLITADSINPELPPETEASPVVPPASKTVGTLTGKWKRLWDMKEAVTRPSTAVTNGKIYAIGGFLRSGISTSVNEYNPILNRWVTRGYFPDDVFRYNLATVGDPTTGKIYMIGGLKPLFDEKHSIANAIESPRTDLYDPKSNFVQFMPDMSTPRDAAGAVYLNGKIYVVGGKWSRGFGKDINFLNSAEVFDTAALKWTDIAPMSVKRYNFQTVVLNGKIYALGGIAYLDGDAEYCKSVHAHYDGTVVKTVEEYDPATNTWTRKADMAQLDKFTRCAVLNGKIYAFESLVEDKDVKTYVEEYDPQLNQWKENTELKPPFSDIDYGTATLDEKLYMIGGTKYSVGNTATYSLDPNAIASDDVDNGLLAEYFNKRTGEVKFIQKESRPFINITDWDNNNQYRDVYGNTFDESICDVRWTGQIKVPKEGRYKFYTVSRGDIILEVNGKRIIDFKDKNTGPAKITECARYINLPNGNVDIRVIHKPTQDVWKNDYVRVDWESDVFGRQELNERDLLPSASAESLSISTLPAVIPGSKVNSYPQFSFNDISGYRTINTREKNGVDPVLDYRKSDGTAISYYSDTYNGFVPYLTAESVYHQSKLTNPPDYDILAHDVKQVERGTLSDTILKNDGTVWEKNGYLNGNGDLKFCLNNVNKIANGLYHTVALRNDGTVYDWGYLNAFSNSTVDKDLSYTMEAGCTIDTPRIPTKIKKLKNQDYSVEFQDQDTHMYTVKMNKKIADLIFDDNTKSFYEKMNLFDNTEKSAELEDLSNIKEIAAGKNNGLALDVNGNLWEWGYEQNTNYLWYHDNKDLPIGLRFLNDALDLINATGIKAGKIAALVNAGTVAFAVAKSQVNGVVNSIPDNVAVKRMSNVRFMSSKGDYVTIIKNDGSVYIWNHKKFDSYYIRYEATVTTPPGKTPVVISLSPYRNDWGFEQYKWNLLSSTSLSKVVEVQEFKNCMNVYTGQNYIVGLTKDKKVKAYYFDEDNPWILGKPLPINGWENVATIYPGIKGPMVLMSNGKMYMNQQDNVSYLGQIPQAEVDNLRIDSNGNGISDYDEAMFNISGNTANNSTTHRDNTQDSNADKIASNTKPQEVTNTVEPSVVTSEGKTIASVDQKAFESALDSGKGEVIIKLPNPQNTTGSIKNEIKVQIPAKGVVEALKQNSSSLTVDMGAVKITTPFNVLNGYVDSKSSNVELSVNQVNKGNFSDEMKKMVGDNPIYDFNLTVDGSKIRDFKGNSVNIELNYSLKSTENPNNIIIYYISDSGKLEVVKNGRYNPQTKKVEFSVNHFSMYMPKEATANFTDINEPAWAKESIEAMAVREYINGTGNGYFKPKDNVTRAEFISMLVNLLDIHGDTDGNSFYDVTPKDWYYKNISIAKANHIIEGAGNNKFKPNEYITREDMMVMTVKALELSNKLDKEASKLSALDNFTDRADIEEYAKNSVAKLVSNGLITGSGSAIEPDTNTTRAEAAVFMYKIFLKY
jgi:alpha-tubulin suppressor-like RCC1 family protein